MSRNQPDTFVWIRERRLTDRDRPFLPPPLHRGRDLENIPVFRHRPAGYFYPVGLKPIDDRIVGKDRFRRFGINKLANHVLDGLGRVL